jgi:hypothetical protein
MSRYILLIVPLIISICVQLIGLHEGYAAELSAGTPDNILIRTLPSFVSTDSLLSTLYRLEGFVTRNSFTDSCVAAAHYLEEKFVSFGLDSVYFHSFDSTYAPNVIGERRGDKYPDKYYVLCAHYDATAGDIHAPEPVAPGANDNGSGIAVVLESARILSRFTLNYTVRFACFSGEEQFMVGSTYYAEDVYSKGEDILGVLNFDMVGYKPLPILDFVVYYYNDSRFLADLIVSCADEFTELVPLLEDPADPIKGGDQYSFYLKGYPSLMCHEGLTNGQRYPWYHSVDDTTGNLNVKYLTAMAVLGLTSIAQLSKPYEGLVAPSPVFTVSPSDGDALISWEDNAERYEDPCFGVSAFEGYRIYRSEADTLHFTPIAEFDRINSIGFDTGLTYSYYDSQLKNGISYFYSVVSFNLFGNESTRKGNIVEIVPGAGVSKSVHKIRTVPNPYRIDESWPGWGKKLRFVNLPARATIRIFTPAGDLVKTIYHDNPTGGYADWIPGDIAGGVYLYTVDSKAGTRVDKFLILK